MGATAIPNVGGDAFWGKLEGLFSTQSKTISDRIATQFEPRFQKIEVSHAALGNQPLHHQAQKRPNTEPPGVPAALDQSIRHKTKF